MENENLALHEIANLISRIKLHSHDLLQATRGAAVDQPAIVARAADIAVDILASEYWLLVLEAGGELSSVTRPVTVNFHVEFTRCKAAFKNRLKERKVSIEIEEDATIRMMGTHPAAKQIPYILLDNAVKYAARGSRISIRLLEPQKKSHTFRISNSGPYVCDAELKNILERGGRGSAALASGVVGAGRGLQILSKILSVSQGTLKVSSNRIPTEIDCVPQGEFEVEITLQDLQT